MEPLSEEIANEVYNVLVQECGARDDNTFISERLAFVMRQTREHIREWRFMGDLGFGGKFWNNNGRFYVNCYPEELNDEKQRMIDRANARLAPIYEKYIAAPRPAAREDK